MKKILLCLFSILLITSCASSDAKKFKKEYESLNNKKEKVEVKIDSNNPIKYITIDDEKKMSKDKETYAIFYGNYKNNWSRIVAPIIIEVSSDLEIENLYYIDISNKDEKIDIPLIKAVVDGKEVAKTSGSSGKTSKLLDMDKEEIYDNILNVLKQTVSATCNDVSAC